MTRRLREIVEAETLAVVRSNIATPEPFGPVCKYAEDYAERVGRRVADEILGICDEGIAFQLNVKEFSEERRDWNAGIIRYLRGQIVRRFGLGDGDGE